MTNATDLLAKYRVNVYGEERCDFDLCLTALNVQVDNVALVHRALDGMAEEMTTNEHTQVIMAAYDMLGNAVLVMNKALTVLADCEVAR